MARISLLIGACIITVLGCAYIGLQPLYAGSNEAWVLLFACVCAGLGISGMLSYLLLFLYPKSGFRVVALSFVLSIVVTLITHVFVWHLALLDVMFVLKLLLGLMLFPPALWLLVYRQHLGENVHPA